MRRQMRAGHDDSNGAVVKLRSASSAQHLHDLQIRVLFAAGRVAVVCHRVFDDDHMARQVYTDSER